MHYLLLGPSGVGKTTFGDWLGANRGFRYLHIDVDGGGKTDALTAEGLKESWDKLAQKDPAPFARKLQNLAKLKARTGVCSHFRVSRISGPGGLTISPNITSPSGISTVPRNCASGSIFFASQIGTVPFGPNTMMKTIL